MMGRQQTQHELWAPVPDLFARIPEDHLLRRLERVLDLSFVRAEVANCYGTNGNASVDPVVLMKMMLLLFLDDVPSERELMRIIPLRLDYLGFLGFGLQDEIPDHSVLSKARRRWGAEVFAQLFARSVEQCVAAGLVEGRKLHVDASLITADASRNSVVRQVVLREVGKLEEVTSETVASSETAQSAKVNESYRSTTDPEASLVRHSSSGKSTPSFKSHRAIDDVAGVITAVATTTGAIDEATQLLPLLEQSHTHTGRSATVAVADSRYGHSANFIALAKRGIRAHVADLRSRQNNHRAADIYAPERFDYDAAQDTFGCPAGQTLTRHHFHQQRGYYEYRPARGICGACALRAHCTKDQAGRTLKRYAGQELLDLARAQSHSAAARRDRRRRQWLLEGSFGRAATQHGFKRARWRGLQRQGIQDHLIAVVQNLLLVLRHAQLPPRSVIAVPCPAVAALGLAPTDSPDSTNAMASFLAPLKLPRFSPPSTS
jgi:transposase